MIERFKEIIPDKLYRGACPTPQDILMLKNKYQINRIISLDQKCGEKIQRSCKMLEIEHLIIPLRWESLKVDLINLFQYNLKDLLLENSPTFIHCFAGKDRTGLVTALFKIKYMNTNPNKALAEAKDLGFGIGMNENNYRLFQKLILNCKPDSKQEVQNIVSNQRDYKSDNRDTFLDEGNRSSFAPHLSPTRQYPMDIVYNNINDQSGTRENYKNNYNGEYVPIVGLFNNDAGVHGMGPVENAGGFIYD